MLTAAHASARQMVCASADDELKDIAMVEAAVLGAMQIPAAVWGKRGGENERVSGLLALVASKHRPICLS